jgi:exonuclease SbcC
MIPLRISLKNFMCYREEQAFLFNGSPLWVLTGPNGSGKSAVFDAITFALYGHHRGGSQHATDLINHNKDSLAVEFDFLVDGEAFRVRRTVPKRGRSTCEAFRLILSERNGTAQIEPLAGTERKEGFERWRELTIGLSYKAFTSCVLLLQGQSDELLRVGPQERYEILAQLIDLCPYQRLHEIADSHRKNSDDRIKTLKRQLDGVPSVTDDDLVAVRSGLEEAQVEWEAAQARVSKLTTLVEQAKQWERLTSGCESLEVLLKQLRKLIDRADEIEAGAASLQELEQSLPALRDLVEQREHLVKVAEEIETLGREVKELENGFAAAKNEQDEAQREVDQLEAQASKFQGDLSAIQSRLLAISPLVNLLKEFESAQADLKQLSDELAELPPDLPETVTRAQERDRQLAEGQSALPWMTTLAEARSRLAEACKSVQGARASVVSVQQRIEQLEGDLQRLSAQVDSAREREKKLSHEVTSANTTYAETRKRRERFEQTAAQPTCELCGQEITPDHAEKERARLDALVITAQAELDELKREHQNATTQLEEIEANSSELNGLLASRVDERNRSKRETEQAEQAVSHYSVEIANAFRNLSPDYRSRVASQAPADEIGWLDTTYPTDDELGALAAEVDDRKSHAQILEQLSQQFEQWKRLDVRREAASERVAKIQADARLPEAQQAGDEQRALEGRKTELEARFEHIDGERRTATAKAEIATRDTEVAKEHLQERRTDLERTRATSSEVERRLQSVIGGLSEARRARAMAFGEIDLKELERELRTLEKYAEERLALERARQSVTDTEERIGSLSSQIKELPKEAWRAGAEIEADLTLAASQQKEFDTKRRQAVARATEIEQQQNQRKKLEKDELDTQRKHDLYSLLAKLLGPHFLQLDLLRRSERAIVELANEVLDGLSRGRMRLELRRDDDEEGSRKALDLVAYNRDVSTQPTAVSLVSGSQKFRIAVSLALAIGQHAGQGARRIESVIIDEGFGSLDKNGRDDMIQELNDLKERLDRIILVSHQEEFAGAFTNGYSVGLVDGASQVSLLEHT